MINFKEETPEGLPALFLNTIKVVKIISCREGKGGKYEKSRHLFKDGHSPESSTPVFVNSECRSELRANYYETDNSATTMNKSNPLIAATKTFNSG